METSDLEGSASISGRDGKQTPNLGIASKLVIQGEKNSHTTGVLTAFKILLSRSVSMYPSQMYQRLVQSSDTTLPEAGDSVG